MSADAVALIIPGMSYGLLDLVHGEGFVELVCRGCGESARYLVAPGRHVEARLEHEDSCPVLEAIRAGERGERRRFRSLLTRARRAIARREAACKN